MNTTVIDEHQVLDQTRSWLETFVIGMNLCPFARAPYMSGRIRFQLSTASDADQLLLHLDQELTLLRDSDPGQIETTLLIHPNALTDFTEYTTFLTIADVLLESMALTGTIQIASFHPDYCFGDSESDDPANQSNRSPYPMLHLLREASIERVLTSVADPDAIWRRNVERLRQPGDRSFKDNAG